MNRHPSAYPLYLFNRLLASDPSLERWRSGLRAVLTAALCAGMFLLLTRWLDLDYKLSLAGIVVPMIAVVAMGDPGRRQQQVTMAWIPVVASAALVVGALVADNPWLSGALFLATIFAAFEARRFGPRGSALGTIAYQSFFYALLFKTPPDKILWLPPFVLAGCAIAYGVHFHLVPEHPGRMVHSELRAFRARIEACLHDLARWLDRDSKAGQARIDAHLAALNAQSLGLESRLAGFADPAGACADDRPGGAELRRRVLGCELALEAIAAVARSCADDARPVLAQRLRALGAAIHRGDAADLADRDGGQAWLTDEQGWRLDRAARTLACEPPWRQAPPATRDEGKPPPVQQPQTLPGPAPRRHPWLDDTTRRALQASVSALGAIVAGHAISSSHWYWSVFAAFVVFTRTATIGQTLSGAWRQVLASIAGLCLGVTVAQFAHGSRGLELGLLFAFIAAGFYAFRGLQNVYTVLLTAMLAMVYELMGMDSEGLLVLRLAETVAGAASAVLSARLVLPVHTQDDSNGKSAALLRSASGLLRAALAEAPRPPWDAVRELDRKLAALRASLGPVTGTAYPASKAHRRRQLDRLSRIAYCIRHFHGLALGQAACILPSPPLQAGTRTLGDALDGVATMLDAPDQPAAALPHPGAAAADDAQAGGECALPLRVASHFLAEADEVLRALRADVAAARP
ncbi:FUSC family protein [Herbaspirillum sp. SJZ107]|uniref:FUSC family protein n=1 Tax=Herbaspirillum sp. SJZ107 TaxID=2572881 RepID=UPI00114ECB87|nr:FUSC family protein [Herbaspirillum sp. SJZ107]TQK07145.1 putative membrane protein YccC [Herbaspirillum sp. SJZ107]